MTKITTDFVGTESTVVTKSRLTQILAYWGASTAGYTTWGQARTDLNVRLLNTTAGVIGEEELAGSFLPKINFLNDPDDMVLDALFGAGEQGVWFDPSDVANVDWRRNLMTFSRDPFAGVSGVVAKANAGINAPTGDQYVRITELSGTGTGKRFFAQNLIPVAGNMTFSFYAKENVGGRWISFRENTTTGFAFAFQPSTGTVSTYAGGASPANVFVQLVAAGVYRVSFVINFGSTAAQSYSLDMIPGAGQSNNYVGDGVSGYDITSVQFESGSTATEYQPITDLNTEVIARFPDATMYQDAAGTTPVYAPNQPVGLRLDKSKGLVLGPELVVNGTFDTNTTGWSTSGASTSVSNGQVTVTVTSTVAYIWQSFSTVVGQTYKVTGNIISFGGSPTFYAIRKADDYAASSNIVNIRSSIGAANGVFVATATTSYIILQVNNVGSTATFDNISVKLLPGNHATQSTDISRPLYGIEPAGGRRNLLTYTEQMDNAVWTKALATVTANSTTAPDGTSTADTITATAAYGNVYQGVTTSASSITISAYAKSNTFGQLGLVVTNNPNSSANYVQVLFNTTNGTFISQEGAGSIYSVTSYSTLPVGNGWYRLSVTASVTTGTAHVALLGLGASAVNGSSVFLWGAQLESNTAATPYQKVVSDYEVTEAGVQTCHYCNYDGTNDGMVTNSINFTATDKMSVFAAVRKNSDALAGMLLELSTDWFTSAGSFALSAPNGDGAKYGIALRGTTTVYAALATFTAPITNVVSQLYDIAGATPATEMVGRVNGSAVSLTDINGAGAGTGNFGNYPLYLGRRGGASLPFNGRDYGIIVTGKLATSTQIGNAESFLLNKLGSLAPVITGVPTIGVN